MPSWFLLPPTVVDKLPKRGHNVRYKGITSKEKFGSMPGRGIIGKRKSRKNYFYKKFGFDLILGQVSISNIRRTVSGAYWYGKKFVYRVVVDG